MWYSDYLDMVGSLHPEDTFGASLPKGIPFNTEFALTDFFENFKYSVVFRIH